MSKDTERLMERTREEIAERLEWWLAYFDNDTDRSRHPDFADDPSGFDETAIEADLYAAARRLRAMPPEGAEPVEIRQWRRKKHPLFGTGLWQDYQGTDEQWEAWERYDSFERRIIYTHPVPPEGERI